MPLQTTPSNAATRTNHVRTRRFAGVVAGAAIALGVSSCALWPGGELSQAVSQENADRLIENTDVCTWASVEALDSPLIWDSPDATTQGGSADGRGTTVEYGTAGPTASCGLMGDQVGQYYIGQVAEVALSRSTSADPPSDPAYSHRGYTGTLDEAVLTVDLGDVELTLSDSKVDDGGPVDFETGLVPLANAMIDSWDANRVPVFNDQHSIENSARNCEGLEIDDWTEVLREWDTEVDPNWGTKPGRRASTSKYPELAEGQVQAIGGISCSAGSLYINQQLAVSAWLFSSPADAAFASEYAISHPFSNNCPVVELGEPAPATCFDIMDQGETAGARAATVDNWLITANASWVGQRPEDEEVWGVSTPDELGEKLDAVLTEAISWFPSLDIDPEAATVDPRRSNAELVDVLGTQCSEGVATRLVTTANSTVTVCDINYGERARLEGVIEGSAFAIESTPYAKCADVAAGVLKIAGDSSASICISDLSVSVVGGIDSDQVYGFVWREYIDSDRMAREAYYDE